jgi:YVTN family beta-propeller protein
MQWITISRRWTAILLALPLAAGTVRIIQTNSAGDDVSIIDPATNKVVGTIKGIEVNHGATYAPDGSRYYITNEAESTLDVVDAKTLKIVKNVPLTGHPNNVTISRDGKKVYVAIAVAPGCLDVIDTTTLDRVKSIPIQGAVHNAFTTPDGKYIIAGSVAGKTLTLIDPQTDQQVWMMKFEGGVRPIAFERNPDGSTKNMYVQISDLHGFAVVDFATHKEIQRVTLPDPAGETKNLEGIQGAPSHGLGMPPDQKTLWVTSKWYGYAFVYSMPDLNLMKSIKVGMDPEWVTFTPDGKFLYVACAGSNWVSVIDVAQQKVITNIPVGQVPKRNITAVLP